MPSERYCVKRNRDGWELWKGPQFWCIKKPNGDGSFKVPHVGKMEYVRRIWFERFE